MHRVEFNCKVAVLTWIMWNLVEDFFHFQPIIILMRYSINFFHFETPAVLPYENQQQPFLICGVSWLQLALDEKCNVHLDVLDFSSSSSH